MIWFIKKYNFQWLKMKTSVLQLYFAAVYFRYKFLHHKVKIQLSYRPKSFIKPRSIMVQNLLSFSEAYILECKATIHLPLAIVKTELLVVIEPRCFGIFVLCFTNRASSTVSLKQLPVVGPHGEAFKLFCKIFGFWHQMSASLHFYSKQK